MILLQETLQLVNDSVPSVHEELQMLKSLPFDEFMDTAVRGVIKFAINLAIAILVFYVGKLAIKWMYRMVHRLLVKREADMSLTTFVLSLIKIVLYFILIVIVIGIMGIETTSFLALFGAAGVAIGMALSGTLQNFAGGVLILMLKPYRVGDYIETQGYAGFVKEIQIFNTIITTYDNKSIILPNGGLSTGSINNWSKEQFRRVDWPVSISYGDNIEAARKAILNIIASDDRIVNDDQHASVVLLTGLGDSSVDLAARAWTRTELYWPVFHEIYERIYAELPKAGVSFPFPQMDVHLDKVEKA